MAGQLSTKEVAALFTVTETTIKRWADEGQLRCVKTPGGHRKFLMKDVIRFAEQHDAVLTGIAPPPGSPEEIDMLEFSVQTGNYRKISGIFFEQALRADRNGLYDLLVYLYKHHIAFATIGDEVIRPAMMRIGELWADGDMEINQEHLASQRVLEALVRLNPELDHKSPNGLSAVCACAEGDYHEIGLRILSYALESEGWTVHFMGANTPFDTLASFTRLMKPDLICLSCTFGRQERQFIDRVRGIGKLARSYGGAFLAGGSRASDHSPADFLCDHITASVYDAVAFVRDRFQLKPGPKKRTTAGA